MNIDDFYLFIRIVELRSLKKAAEELSTEASTVSRRLGALESRLGLKLIERSKKGSYPTDAGNRYYLKLKPWMDGLAQIEADVSDTKVVPTGLLRISCPVDFGAKYVADWLHDFQLMYSDLKVELILSDKYIDLQEDGIDVALRIGELENSSLIAKKLGVMSTTLVGSPTYLEQVRDPESIEEIEKLNFILYSWLKTSNKMSIRRDKELRTINMQSNFSINNIGAIKSLVMKGAGVHFAPNWHVKEELKNGKLQALLTTWKTPDFPFNAVYLYSPIGYVPAKIKLVTEFLQAKTQSLILN